MSSAQVAPSETNPTFARRALAAALSGHRGDGPLEDLAKLLRVSEAQASKLDNGRRGFQLDQVDVLAEAYGLDDRTHEELRALATEARSRSAWWQQMNLSETYRTLIGMERAADSISEFCATVVPGLLQTEAYAAAATEIMSIDAKPDEIRTAVQARLRRQDILTRPSPPKLTVVLDEGCLARSPRDTAVMRDQLDHLLKLGQSGPRLRIHVIPLAAGLYPTHSVQFIILRMPEGTAPSVTYSETATDAKVDDDPAGVAQAEEVWKSLIATALGWQDSIDLIAEHRNRI